MSRATDGSRAPLLDGSQDADGAAAPPIESLDELDNAVLKERNATSGGRTRLCTPYLAFTCVGVLVGLVGGYFLSHAGLSEHDIVLVGFLGELLLRMLTAMVVPLVVTSIILGVYSIGEVSGAGRLGRTALFYYFATMIIAAFLGVLLVTTIRPGDSSKAPPPEDELATVLSGSIVGRFQDHNSRNVSTVDAVLDVFRHMVPNNLVQAAYETNILGLISFSLFFGVLLSAIGEEGRVVCDFTKAVNKVIMRFVEAMLLFAPLGICSLIMARLAASEDIFGQLKDLGLYFATVVAGLVLHATVVLPILYYSTTGGSPLQFLLKMAPAILSAFGTSSSAAALPLTIKCAEEAGVEESISRFVLPLGATVNMDGTALYEAVAAIFIAQVNDVSLSGTQIFVVVLVSVLAAVGAAGIPEAGLVTLLMVMQAVGLSEYAGSVSFIFAVDWLLDRIRTAVNVAGDAVIAAAIDKREKRRRKLID